MEELTKKTESYKTVGILDKTTVHPFDIGSLGDLDHTQASAMSLYVQDTEQKLEVLDDLANRTRHLLDSVNGKFHHKKIRLDREEGLCSYCRAQASLKQGIARVPQVSRTLSRPVGGGAPE